MNETLKRALSGAVYVILLLGCIRYSQESFFILFGIFLLIGVYEFCKLVQLQKFTTISIANCSLFCIIFLWIQQTYDLLN